MSSDNIGHVGQLKGSNTVLSGQIPDTVTAAPGPSVANTPFKINITRSKPRLQQYDDDTETVVQPAAQYSPPSVRSSKFKTDIPTRERKYHRLAEEVCDSDKTGQVKVDDIGQPSLSNIALPSPFLRSASQPILNTVVSSELSTSPKRTRLFDLMGVKTQPTDKPQAIPGTSQETPNQKGVNPGAIPDVSGNLHKESISQPTTILSAPSSPDTTPRSSPKPQRKGLIGWLLGEDHSHKDRPLTSTTSPTKSPRGFLEGFFHTNKSDGSCVDGKVADYPLPSKQEFFHQKEDYQFLKPTDSGKAKDTSNLKGKVLVNNSDLNAFAPQNM